MAQLSRINQHWILGDGLCRYGTTLKVRSAPVAIGAIPAGASPGQEGVTRLTINDPEVIEVRAEAFRINIGVGYVYDELLTAEADFSDGQTYDVTLGGKWTTSNGNLDIVDGVEYGVSEGKTTVTLELEGIKSNPLVFTVFR